MGVLFSFVWAFLALVPFDFFFGEVVGVDVLFQVGALFGDVWALVALVFVNSDAFLNVFDGVTHIVCDWSFLVIRLSCTT